MSIRRTGDGFHPGLFTCLKNHFHNLQAPLCGIFYLRSVAVARYAASFG
ncbi:DUF6783 domain-containing protein [Oliverpabstia intestinalis]